MAGRLTRVPSLKERLDETLTAQRNEILSFLSRYFFIFDFSIFFF